MQKTNHPIEVGLVLGWLAVEAVAVLVVGAVALLVVLACSTDRAAAPAAPPAPVPSQPPAEAPLAAPAALVALELEHRNVAQLRSMARRAGLPRSLSRAGRRDALVAALAGLEVAMV